VSQNVEIVRQAHEAFNRPDLGVFDLDAFYRLADPDLVVDWSRSNGLDEDCGGRGTSTLTGWACGLGSGWAHGDASCRTGAASSSSWR
jgi:hypothetical protein